MSFSYSAILIVTASRSLSLLTLVSFGTSPRSLGVYSVINYLILGKNHMADPLSRRATMLTDEEYERMQDRRMRHSASFKKKHKPIFQISTDILVFFFFFILCGLIWYLSEEKSMGEKVTKFAINWPIMILVSCLFFKFAIGLCVFKTIGRGNTKEVTLPIFILRICFDIVFFSGLAYLISQH